MTTGSRSKKGLTAHTMTKVQPISQRRPSNFTIDGCFASFLIPGADRAKLAGLDLLSPDPPADSSFAAAAACCKKPSTVLGWTLLP